MNPVVLQREDPPNVEDEFDLIQGSPVLARSGQDQSRVTIQDQPGIRPILTGSAQLQREVVGDPALPAQPIREFVKSVHRQDIHQDPYPHLPPELRTRSQIRRRRRGA